METITYSAQQTQRLGEQFARHLTGGEVIALIGPLGSGKTTFVQGLARGLGIERRVVSPTFVFIRDYELKGGRTLFHVDLYRISFGEEVKALGLEEIWSDPKHIVVIEWAEKIREIWPPQTIKVYFEYLGSNKRKIRYAFNH